MIRAHLGETIDIHGGGLDLIFPHHENEIAQSRCAHGGAPLANYWVHNGFVDMGAEKMSKSVGNVVGVDALLAAGHRGEVLRLALLSAHNRSPLPWTESLIAQSKATLDGLYRRVKRYYMGLADFEPAELPAPDVGVIEALSDDLNTPLAMKRLLELRYDKEIAASAKALGLFSMAGKWFDQSVAPGERAMIEVKIVKRKEAKAARDFATADHIRDELMAEGILLEDGPDGTSWRRA